MKVLVVDDDTDVRDVVERALAIDDNTIIGAQDLASAKRALLERPDLIVLDLGLPDGSGLNFCRTLRAEGLQVPVLILTARSQVALRVQGLDAGADDYLSKPFALAELRARVRALARRVATPTFRPAEARAVAGDVTLDFAKRTALRAGVEVPVTARQWAILDTLAARAGAVVSRDDLLETVWGDATEANGNSLEVLVGRMRKKLGASIIRTVRGEGYAFWSTR